MHDSHFEIRVRRDENRARDGELLREEFLYSGPVLWPDREVDHWLSEDCSVLELVVALADRATDTCTLASGTWLDILLENLDAGFCESDTRSAIKRLNERSYSYDGSGGLFPLRNPARDQRTVELWYQMQEYIIENYMGMGGE